MNFKPDWIKLGSSVIVGVLIGLFYSNSKMVFGEYEGLWYSFLSAFLLSSLVVYAVWSFFDK
ncbi:hypothetical protein AUJ61_03450 [Candidatus Pacearchaeota archaeon CG1_02_30_18]|nr:hypothetical protein [Candidatus Pacearchaeota archaeon]OIO39807.1 MAG: hypothetical protein AUJ61_03450 [Candidatus Pacearchaeota archaeon CG1_02_30_18]PIZ82231.1 MAG: hypothetical protein COX98_00520 [Candidatus Pacearchaeota archaeon CG_4_10_14_0_2_um_filter_30_11]